MRNEGSLAGTRSCGDPSHVVLFLLSIISWRSKPVVVLEPIDDSDVVFPPTDRDGEGKPLPPTPGLKPAPPSIAQLAFPSPDETSSPSDSSNASHEPFYLAKYDVTSPRLPNKLKKLKKPPPSSYPYSFVAEDPSPEPNFPYTFFHRHRSTPNSPASSFIAGSVRALSMHPPSPARKLTKRRPSIPEHPASADADITMASRAERPPIQRSSTMNFSFRRKRTTSRTAQTEDGHSILPALPPPSPLTLNIPTFRSFHARKRDSWHVQSGSQPPVDQRRSTSDARGDFSEVAWTGFAPKAFDTIIRARGGWRSTWSLSLSRDDVPPLPRAKPKFVVGDETESPRSESPEIPTRPPLLRRHATTASPKRRWTLAMALNDEGISDELLVQKLEALRTRSRAASVAVDDNDIDEWDNVWAAYDDELDVDDSPPLPSLPPTPPPKDGVQLGQAQRTASLPALPSPSTASWHSARRALLTCRELVRTERHYLAALHALLDGATRSPPPPLMRAYAAALARESAGLLRRMEEDPSAWGVAAAFLGAEEGVEAALVGWSGVVGGWFVDGEKAPRRLSKMRGLSEGGEEETAPKPPAKRVGWKRNASSGVIAVPSLRSLPPLPSVLSLSSTSAYDPPSPVSATPKPRSRKERDARPAVRDLAIVPTQRVMRYVLLYQDLLEHTPVTSPSRVLVARAVDASMRIAQRCDRAQGNAAFLQRR
ncbi:hypothetical protein C8R47DRAFT_196045 [Mycena vitilis]|nr:hypothetical protein C8R47DRAFT_196045 [Mycena vitilis]